MSRRTLPGFLVVGGIGFVVDAAVLQLFFMLGYGAVVSRFISVAVAVTATWLLNRRYVFRTGGRNAKAPEFLRHVIAQGGGMVVNLAVYFLLLATVPELRQQPVIALAAGSIAAMIVNYLGAKYWTFKHRGDSSDAVKDR